MRIQMLADHHRLAAFSSGNKTLDAWLQRFALENQRRDISRTFVLVDVADEVVGYYSLNMGASLRTTSPLRCKRAFRVTTSAWFCWAALPSRPNVRVKE